MPPQCTSIAERFWPKVDKSGPVPAHRPELGPCWVWTGSFGSTGYGQIGSGGKHGRPLGAHVVSYELHVAPVPTGLCVLHHCDYRPCVRPEHLFVGTKRDNSRDMAAKGRWRNVPLVGSLNGRAKVTPALAAEIRAAYAQGGATQQALADHYGVTQTTIGRIVRNEAWAS